MAVNSRSGSCESEVKARGPNYTKHGCTYCGVASYSRADSILCGARSSLLFSLAIAPIYSYHGSIVATPTAAEILRSEGLTLAQSSRRVRHDMQSRHRRTRQLTIL